MAVLIAVVVLAVGAPGGTAGPRVRAETVNFEFWAAGNGTVTATPEGGSTTSCKPNRPESDNPCFIDVENGTKVTLTAVAEPGSTFKRWSTYGCDDPDRCVVTVDGDGDTVTATFSPLRLEVIWAGTGTVEAVSGQALSCDVDPTGAESICTATLDADTAVVLKATPGVAGESVQWGPGCDVDPGDPTQCTVTMTNTRTFATLAFGDNPVPDFPFQIFVKIHVAVGGTGHGTVKGSGKTEDGNWSVDCPGTCDTPGLLYQTTVRLTAQEGNGSTFVRWEHVCGTSNPCAFSAGSATRVRAIFDAKSQPPPPPPPPPCSELSAQLRKVTKSGTGRSRAISAVVIVRDDAHGVFALVGRRTLASRQFELVAGRNSLRLPVPRAVKPGWYRVRVKLTRPNCAGATLTRPIKLGR